MSKKSARNFASCVLFGSSARNVGAKSSKRGVQKKTKTKKQNWARGVQKLEQIDHDLDNLVPHLPLGEGVEDLHSTQIQPENMR